jgi:hypothetical protein
MAIKHNQLHNEVDNKKFMVHFYGVKQIWMISLMCSYLKFMGQVWIVLSFLDIISS